MSDPQNWERFKRALDEHYDDEDIEFQLGVDAIKMQMGDVQAVFYNADLDPDAEGQPIEEIDGPEDLPIQGDLIAVNTPTEEFEVLFEEREQR
jgi:hypothetical protein